MTVGPHKKAVSNTFFTRKQNSQLILVQGVFPWKTAAPVNLGLYVRSLFGCVFLKVHLMCAPLGLWPSGYHAVVQVVLENPRRNWVGRDIKGHPIVQISFSELKQMDLCFFQAQLSSRSAATSCYPSGHWEHRDCSNLLVGQQRPKMTVAPSPEEIQV